MTNPLYRAWLHAWLASKSKGYRSTASRIREDSRETVIQNIIDNPFITPESAEDHILAALDRDSEKNPHLYKPKPPDFSKMTGEQLHEWSNENSVVKREPPQK